MKFIAIKNHPTLYQSRNNTIVQIIASYTWPAKLDIFLQYLLLLAYCDVVAELAQCDHTEQGLFSQTVISHHTDGPLSCVIWGPFWYYGFILIPAWISNRIHSKLWDEITYQFPNFNGCTVEVWEWISNFSHTYSCWVLIRVSNRCLWWVLSVECLIHTLHLSLS